MLSKCYGSTRNVFKGWFLKLNKNPVLAMTICHFPDTFITSFGQFSNSSLQGLYSTPYFKLCQLT